ncbi:MAG: hypothetical protein MJ252_21045, partial [archaeon]|nr:hypothetical protein [archaeon]
MEPGITLEIIQTKEEKILKPERRKGFTKLENYSKNEMMMDFNFTYQNQLICLKEFGLICLVVKDSLLILNESNFSSVIKEETKNIEQTLSQK